MPINFGERLPCDPRVIGKIQRSPQMMAEQGPAFLSGWGGSQGYQYWAKEPEGKRVTYFAVKGGASESSEISNMTGLEESEVSKWLTILQQEGLITIES